MSKTNPSMARIKLKKSKTDPFRQGVDIYVGRTFGQLCHVAAILAYLAVRGPDTGPLFMFADGRFLTQDRFVTRVRGALTAAGLDCSQYAGHSFRIRAATTAAQKGIKDSTIKMLGRWQSSAYLLWVLLGESWVCVYYRGLLTVSRETQVYHQNQLMKGDLTFKGKLLPLGPTECGHLTL